MLVVLFDVLIDEIGCVEAFDDTEDVWLELDDVADELPREVVGFSDTTVLLPTVLVDPFDELVDEIGCVETFDDSEDDCLELDCAEEVIP